METKKVYLSGPMHGRSLFEQKNWRNSAKILLGNIPCIDPTELDSSGLTPHQIVERDLNYIDTSTFVLLVWYDQPSVGTSMEIFNADLMEIPVFVVNSSHLRENDLPIWLLARSTKIFTDLRSACEAIRVLDDTIKELL